MVNIMTSKVKIKMGHFELEYEGSEDFLKEELPEILERITELYKQSNLKDGDIVSDDSSNSDREQTINLSITNIASKLGVKSGSDLTLAAAAYLTFVDCIDTFDRRKILDVMKKATGYYEETFRKNLTNQLSGLIKNDKLNQHGSGSYALSIDIKNDLETKLV